MTDITYWWVEMPENVEGCLTLPKQSGGFRQFTDAHGNQQFGDVPEMDERFGICIESTSDAAARTTAMMLYGLPPICILPMPAPPKQRATLYNRPGKGITPAICMSPWACAGSVKCQNHPACNVGRGLRNGW